jgi:predicted signal transduction protein with EAL and GGDEF domain
VIAEGIETEQQLALLKNLGCEYGQGYLFAKPQTKENIERSLYEGRNWMAPDSYDHPSSVPEPIIVNTNLPVF